MDILTKKGKLLLKNIISTISLCVVSSIMTTIYIRTEYMDKNILKETFSALGVDRETLNNKFKEIEPESVIIYDTPEIENNKTESNISTILSVVRPINDSNISKLDKIVYTVTNDLKRAIYGYESEYNTTALSRSKDHSGICQMGDDALSDVGYKGNHFEFAKENRMTQDLYCTKRFISIISLLRKKKIKPTIYTVYTVHQQGYKNGILLLKSKNKIPNRTNLVSNINDKYLLKAWENQTKAELLKWYNKPSATP